MVLIENVTDQVLNNLLEMSVNLRQETVSNFAANAIQTEFVNGQSVQFVYVTHTSWLKLVTDCGADHRYLTTL